MRTEPSWVQANLAAAAAALYELELWWMIQAALTSGKQVTMSTLGEGSSDRFTEFLLLARACITRTNAADTEEQSLKRLRALTVGQALNPGAETPILRSWSDWTLADAFAEALEQAAAELEGMSGSASDRVDSVCNDAPLLHAKAQFLERLSESLRR